MYNCFFGMPTLFPPNFRLGPARNPRQHQSVRPDNYDPAALSMVHACNVPDFPILQSSSVSDPSSYPAPHSAGTPSCRMSHSAKSGNCSLKHSDTGGIILPENTDKNSTYIITSINLDTSSYKIFSINFSFSCSISTAKAQMHLKFQLLKQERYQLSSFPVGSSFVYSRTADSTETNTFSLTAWDLDSMSCKCCTYYILAEVMSFPTVGVTTITNPILSAYIIEKH